MVHLHPRQQLRGFLNKQINVLSNMLHPGRNSPSPRSLLPRVLHQHRDGHLVLQLLQFVLCDIHAYNRRRIQRDLTRRRLGRLGIGLFGSGWKQRDLKTRRNREVFLFQIGLVVLRTHYIETKQRPNRRFGLESRLQRALRRAIWSLEDA